MFHAQTFLDRAGLARTAVQYAQSDANFLRGDTRSQHVMYIPAGSIKLPVVSQTGREEPLIAEPLRPCSERTPH